MKKEYAAEVKNYIDEITSNAYTKTFSGKSGTLHIRIGTYCDGRCDETWYNEKIAERKSMIKKISERFPEYEVAESNKRYQGFINDICITVH